MADADDLDHEPVIDDRVHDPVTADSCPVRGRFAVELDATRR